MFNIVVLKRLTSLWISWPEKRLFQSKLSIALLNRSNWVPHEYNVEDIQLPY